MIRPGEVAWYATGRFYAATDQSLFDAGYFVHLQGIDGALFADDAIGEGSAYFTFAATPFTATDFMNGALKLGLASSQPFEFGGSTYDFAELLPHGITQWGTASPEPIAPPPAGFTAVVPFVGSAIKVG